MVDAPVGLYVGSAHGWWGSLRQQRRLGMASPHAGLMDEDAGSYTRTV